jgi:acyl carrier protein
MRSLTISATIGRVANRRYSDGFRVSLTDGEFCSLFAAADADVALTIRNQLKGYLIIPVELVRPDDKLCADIGLGIRDGLDANCFVRDVQRATGATIPDIDAENLYTLRDIVAFVSTTC